MKRMRLMLLLSWLGAAFGLQAQVVLNASDFPSAGDVWINATDTLVASVDVGMAGANQTWDISADLQADLVQTQFFVLPDTTPWAAFFPGANLALGFPGVGYNYLFINSMEALSLGFAGSDPTGNFDQEFVVPFEDPQTVAVFPAEMGVSFTDMSAFSLTIPGDGVNFDSIRFKSITMDTVEYDGWGTVTTPNGTYSALRSHTNTTQIDSVWAYFFGIEFFLDATVTHTQSWEWLSPQTKGPVATATVDEFGNWTVSWSLLSPPPVAQFTYQDMGNGLFQFTDQSGNNPDSWLWDFGDGNTSTEQNPTHTYTSSGDYTVCLTVSNSAGTDTACQTISVTVTGLTEAWSHLSLALYPNPASSELHVQIDWAEPLQWELYDALGRKVRARTFVQTATVQVTDLPQGTYLYALRTPDGQLVARGQILVVH